MKGHKVRSIKKASFYGMLRYSYIFVIINFIIISAFTLILAYLLISIDETNLANILVNDVIHKENKIKNVSMDLSELLYEEGLTKEQRKKLLDQKLSSEEDILAVLTLDQNGIVTSASKGHETFLGYDFSGRPYFQKAKQTKEIAISDPVVAYGTNQTSVTVVTPVIRKGQVQGMVLTIVNPAILYNDRLQNLEYFVVSGKGDILFHSNHHSREYYQDNILDMELISNVKPTEHKTFFYKDRVTGKHVLRTIKSDDMGLMYIMIQYDIFGNHVLFSGLTIVLILLFIFVSLFVFLFSVKFSSIATKYMAVFSKELKKIETGNYSIEVSEKYPYVELNEIINTFMNMAKRVSYREQELQVYNEELRAANDEIKDMLDTIHQNEKERQEQYIRIISTILNLIEIKDEYTAGHSRAVTYYSEQIARKLNKEYGFQIDVEKLKVGAILHDVGKISIERNILNKPTRLTEEEFNVIKTHPTKGFYALKEIENLQQERDMVKYHHERYDGKGYPEGRKGEAIPLYARIICVADAFDAMTSDRPYRKAMPVVEAMGELTRNRGIQFDPLVVDVFIELLQEKGDKQLINRQLAVDGR